MRVASSWPTGLKFLLAAHVPGDSYTAPRRHGRITHPPEDVPHGGFGPDLSCYPALSHGSSELPTGACFLTSEDATDEFGFGLISLSQPLIAVHHVPSSSWNPQRHTVTSEPVTCKIHTSSMSLLIHFCNHAHSQITFGIWPLVLQCGFILYRWCCCRNLFQRCHV